MDLVDRKMSNRENLYFEVAFLDAMQQWKREPHISFLRIFKDTCKKRKAWADSFQGKRETVLRYVASYMQMSMAMQTICYAYEMIKDAGLDQSAQGVKNTLKNIKTKLDIDGKEKTTNALQMIKIVREAFAHNDDGVAISNWELSGEDDKFVVTVQSEIKRGGDRHNISFKLRDLLDLTSSYLSNLVNLDNKAIELDVNGKKLEKICQNGKLTKVQANKHIKQSDKDSQQEIETEDRQLEALCNCFNSEFFHNETMQKSVASPFRPDFVVRVFPFKHSAPNHVLDLRFALNSLYHLYNNPKSCYDWFNAMVNGCVSNPDATCEEVTYLHYLFFEGVMDSIIISNMLFSIFSFESSAKIDEMFNGTGVDTNRIRNSVMHGRFYYNYNNAYDFYDGRDNQNLVYVGTLTVEQITTAAQKLISEYISEQQNTTQC